ncbi:glycosyltransferase family 2 protein [Verrucomicrobiota bacterium]
MVDEQGRNWELDKMTEFSIIIPTWKNIKYLDLAYRSIAQNSAADHEVIVFFNEFDEDCEQWLKDKNVLHDKAAENLGVCGAVNRAAKLATQKYICFMNDDMYVLPGWDTALEKYFDLSDKLWLSGTAVEAGKATPCYIGGCDYGDSPENFQEEKLLKEYETLKRSYDVVSTWTPILISKSNWDEIDGLDENYFPGNGSDPDLAMKMYQYGCRHFIGVGTSLVYHFSRSTISRFDDKKTMDQKDYFKQKWGMSWKKFFRKVIHRDKMIQPPVDRS